MGLCERLRVRASGWLSVGPIGGLERSDLGGSELTVRVTRGFKAVESTEVQCIAGTGWITNDRDCSDVIVTGGQSHLVPPQTNFWITGMPWCSVRVTASKSARDRPV